MINYHSIVEHCLSKPYEVRICEFHGKDFLTVAFDVSNIRVVEIVHGLIEEITELPKFFLKNSSQYGALAHVLPNLEEVEQFQDYAFICVSDLGCLSVNYDQPELVFEAAIEMHIEQLTKALTDKPWNEKELLREFQVFWQRVIKQTNFKRFIRCALNTLSDKFQKIEINYGAESRHSKNLIYWTKSSQKQASWLYDIAKDFFEFSGTKSAFVIPLSSVAPPPLKIDAFKKWFIDLFAQLEPSEENKIKQLFHKSGEEFVLLFNVETEFGKTWFGVQLNANKKTKFPSKIEHTNRWNFTPFFIDMLNKNTLMPRSGAITSLHNKRVMLVGCGSVGSELALKLGSAGIGHINLVDTDTYSSSNIYRHTLELLAIGKSKTEALRAQLTRKFPWIEVATENKKLLDIRHKTKIEDFDLIIIAIGSPTDERLFSDFCQKQMVKSPVIYSWLEGYGIGGHAIVDFPAQQGCLKCAYVDALEYKESLHANVNFLKKNQVVVKNYAGCSETFVSYGAIASTQTAVVAADLAIKILNGKINQSSKVSWKGDATEALREGLKLSTRYQLFNRSLIIDPLYHPLCRQCNDGKSKIYQGHGVKVSINQAVWEYWQKQRQIESNTPEAAGYMIGHQEAEQQFRISQVTQPKTSDKRDYCYFELDKQAHDRDLEATFYGSEQFSAYRGTWHTHPQHTPTPSRLDKKDWHKQVQANPDHPLFFVIIGTHKTKVFWYSKKKFLELKNEN